MSPSYNLINYEQIESNKLFLQQFVPFNQFRFQNKQKRVQNFFVWFSAGNLIGVPTVCWINV